MQIVFKIEIFQSRLGCVKIFIEIIKNNQDCQDFLDRWDWLFFGVEIESLDRDHVEKNWDPQDYLKCKYLWERDIYCDSMVEETQGQHC
jgi:hypothetical protein